MSDCSNNCSTCGSDCASRKTESLLAPLHEGSRVNKVIGIVSGKGGVGKSMVSSMLAANFQKKGHQTAILDADITGPSIPKAFGVNERATSDETAIYPVTTKSNIQLMSVNLLLEDITDPVIWRGPIIGSTVKQFWSDVVWNAVDYMFVDMPPGTGDVPLTVFQSIPLDGIIIVTSPQELVSLIVSKAVKMAQMMNIPILGIIENMSYVECPDCGTHISVFGESHVQEVAQQYDIPVLGQIPITPAIATASDTGTVEDLDSSKWFETAIAAIEQA